MKPKGKISAKPPLMKMEPRHQISLLYEKFDELKKKVDELEEEVKKISDEKI